VSANRRVPLIGLDVLPLRAVLQIEFSLRVKYMKVYDGVKLVAPIVTFAARGAAYDISFLINEGEEFVLVVEHVKKESSE
jgi:hypothetical protein